MLFGDFPKIFTCINEWRIIESIGVKYAEIRIHEFYFHTLQSCVRSKGQISELKIREILKLRYD